MLMENSEKKKGGGLPRGMPISAAVLLVLGLIAMQVMPSVVSEEQMARNVLLAAIPFILIFAAIIIAFMSLVWYASSKLSGNVPEKTYRPLEYALMGGILLGIFLMFQPWVFILFRIGFYLLLASTLLYILWSHVRPKGEDVAEQPTAPADIEATLTE
jgi:hypothetical protein